MLSLVVQLCPSLLHDLVPVRKQSVMCCLLLCSKVLTRALIKHANELIVLVNIGTVSIQFVTVRIIVNCCVVGIVRSWIVPVLVN
jgi:hypothetical protein